MVIKMSPLAFKGGAEPKPSLGENEWQENKDRGFALGREHLDYD